jgi:hypothetical protein
VKKITNNKTKDEKGKQFIMPIIPRMEIARNINRSNRDQIFRQTLAVEAILFQTRRIP